MKSTRYAETITKNLAALEPHAFIEDFNFCPDDVNCSDIGYFIISLFICLNNTSQKSANEIVCNVDNAVKVHPDIFIQIGLNGLKDSFPL